MSSNESIEQSLAPAADPTGEEAPRRNPLWGKLTIALIALMALLILFLANLKIRQEQSFLLFSNELIPVKVSAEDTALWGYMNEDGELAVSAQFEDALDFSENGLAAVKKNGLWGFIDQKGNVVIPYTYEEALSFGKGELAAVKKDGLWGFVDEDGYLFITGRIKTVIVLENGKNVFPEEIEEYLGNIEKIAEGVVVGRPSGETVNLVAIAYPDYTKYPEGTTEEEIFADLEKEISAMNKKLPTYKQIKSLELRDTDFEKTTSKKIKRHLVK